MSFVRNFINIVVILFIFANISCLEDVHFGSKSKADQMERVRFVPMLDLPNTVKSSLTLVFAISKNNLIQCRISIWSSARELFRQKKVQGFLQSSDNLKLFQLTSTYPRILVMTWLCKLSKPYQIGLKEMAYSLLTWEGFFTRRIYILTLRRQN